MTRRLPALSALSLSTLSLCGCLGTPTPLSPGLAGSVGWPHHGVQTGAVMLMSCAAGLVFSSSHAPGMSTWPAPWPMASTLST